MLSIGEGTIRLQLRSFHTCAHWCYRLS